MSGFSAVLGNPLWERPRVEDKVGLAELKLFIIRWI